MINMINISGDNLGVNHWHASLRNGGPVHHSVRSGIPKKVGGLLPFPVSPPKASIQSRLLAGPSRNFSPGPGSSEMRKPEIIPDTGSPRCGGYHPRGKLQLTGPGWRAAGIGFKSYSIIKAPAAPSFSSGPQRHQGYVEWDQKPGPL
jgi:hypothetical protein